MSNRASAAPLGDTHEGSYSRLLAARRQHVVGARRGAAAGPTVVCVGAVHGNEWSGVWALRRVLSALDDRDIEVRGEFVAIVGNLSALCRRQRFVAADLNRHWLASTIDSVRRAAPATLADEDLELRELLDVLHEVFERARGAVFFLDLHTSSAPGDPFVCIGDTLRNRAFAEAFCVPIILGLEEQIDGSLLEYVNNLGHVTVGVEAGQHDAKTSIDHHEAAVWLGLARAGVVREGDAPALDRRRERLRRASHHLHGFMEVRHRHPIVAEDDFHMNEGFVNFHTIDAGQLLARDCRGEIHAVESGRILLPLYQGQGSEGFFIAREIKAFWLRVSTFLRRLRLERVAHWLPGVQRHPSRQGALVIRTNLARWFALETFHLLGYRKRRSEEGVLVVSRRRFDTTVPGP